ncbi:MAG: Eco57I restriction-modification methylase domain-containing protein [Gemmatimonadetes bacterium]|nr:Eco57I restriction-modification methylase domain-containing protein [Gemmatimonadota bacterium]
MNDIEYKQKISGALQRFKAGDLAQNARNLLNTLGYHSDLEMDIEPNTAKGFIAEFDLSDKMNRERAQIDDWVSIDLLFQLREEEITESDNIQIPFDNRQIDNTRIESYLFFALKLQNGNYTRTQLSNITREINKLTPMPAMVLFQHGQTLTFSIIDRRLHKRDESRDVLEKVTLIKNIDCSDPHRAHIEILFDLALEQLHKTHGIHNFVALHRAWAKTLNIQELNKQFYRELSDWYFWAVDQVTFPADMEKDKEIRNATSLIRLITRLIFVWFIKEKGLVQNALFDKKQIDKILKNTDPLKSTYYKAVLQNLFFATLNTEMKPKNRKFRHRAKQSSGRDQHYMVHSLYRYERYFNHSKEALGFFQEIPFLNGGLFECLDKPGKDNSKKILRVDGFSDRNDIPLHVPNFLFFSDEQDVDLNAAYGTKGKRYKVRGLINILDRYKFTVAENTPIEEEVALDPELLGKVFENLLAAYNPETQTTARKQTGSFYTPREIVNYMTDESLIAYFKSTLISSYESKSTLSATTPPSQLDLTGQTEPVQSRLEIQKGSLSDKQKAFIESNLRHLITYNDEPHRFCDEETEQLIKAIDDLKILDPACGSGEFPMGILRKLVFILGKLDPGNDQWRQRQIARVESTIETAEKIDDSTVRENTIRDLEQEIDNINEAFERNELDYGRKLYLIENCIYGVDIQPIAVQISKLRFFISLIVDQKIDNSRENRGVRPLPNLETKFVAANTLLSVDKPAQISIRNPQIDQKEKELAEVRRKYFTARTPRTKDKYRGQDDQIRAEISELLKRDGFPSETTEKIAYWNPYDQNATADFFDQEWMFGIKDGFNVVIGNPPYIQLQKDNGKLGKLYKDSGFATFIRTGDIYCLFYEKGVALLKADGHLCYITSNKWMRAGYGKKLREFFAKKTNTKNLLDFGGFQVFETATVDTNILLIEKASPRQQLQATHFKSDFKAGDSIGKYVKENAVHLPRLGNDTWFIGSKAEINLKEKIERIGKPLKEWDISIYRGVLTGYNDAFIINNQTKDALVAQDANSAEIIKPILRGRDIKRYQANWAGLWLIDSHNGYDNIPPIDIENYPAIKAHLDKFYTRLEKRQDKGVTPYNLRNCAYHAEFEKEKIVWADLSRSGNSFSYDKNMMFPLNTGYIMTGESMLYLLAVLNSKAILCYLDMINQKLDKNGWRWIHQYVVELPIPKLTVAQQQPFINLVDQILATKTKDQNIDITELENQINKLVYQLYELNIDEIKIIEGT